MAELKREYVVPLRRKVKLAPRWRRSKKAVSVLTEFIKKHMKTDNVIICNDLNEHLWKDGGKNPPGKVQVIALKRDFSGNEKTLVNLAQKGVDEQVKLYESAMKAPIQPKGKKKEEEKVQEAEVKEVEHKEKKEEAGKEAEEKKIKGKEEKRLKVEDQKIKQKDAELIEPKEIIIPKRHDKIKREKKEEKEK